MKSEIRNLLFIIFSALILRVLFDFINGIEIHYEEAQYWVWSKDLNLGYYSKPPFLPWVIALITGLLGMIFGL